ncbi:MAG: glycerophosphodiester phosphodiesterase [Cohaesibacteraceae bacterium]|nr:glycerophosphodiester phosphodiesterase [Cohaesibacteraceae bacterium]MBL4876592.1 glycerophosphodiester phosphodiesterase [Cohaesibacteraceae bacterium]
MRWLTARPIAHRGFHNIEFGRVENTPDALEAAIDHNYTIEIDVQLTHDDNAVTFHDFTLDRLTHSTGRLRDKTLFQLRDVAYRASNNGIESLAETLKRIDGRVPVIIELKSNENEEEFLANQVVKCVSNYNGEVALMSFNPKTVTLLKSLIEKPIPVGIVSCAFTNPAKPMPWYKRKYLQYLLHWPRSRPDFISYAVKDFPSFMPWVARLAGIPVICWTVRSAADREIAYRYADQVTFEGYDPSSI